MSEPGDDFMTVVTGAAQGAVSKEVADMTDLEKFSIAYLAGVPLKQPDMRDWDGKTHGFTLDTCVIIKDPDTGKFHVFCEEKKHE